MKKQSILKGLLAPALLGLACNANASLLIGGDAVNQASATSILDIVFATRNPEAFKLGALANQIQLGASPRATLCLNLAARANALIHGRTYATPQDVKEIAHDVLRHRITLTYEAEAESVTTDTLITRLLSEIPVP